MTTTPTTNPSVWQRLRDIKLPQDDTAMLGGVCAAFGEATPIPAWMWRVGFCATVLAWGTGVVAYGVLMLCIPAKPTQEEDE
jgi:phage shock protein PspC (stress-responsive transcriptional regulator)